MPRRGILERFRPAAPPGAAGRVGVPSDTSGDVALLAVLAALGPVQDEAERIREAAQAQADALRDQADVEAAAILARARVAASEQRAAAAAAAHEAGERRGEQMVDEARAAADRLRLEGQQRLPALVDLITDLIRSEEPRPSGAVGAGPGRRP